MVRADTGGKPGVWAATPRTLLRLVDGFGSYLPAFITSLASERNQSFGDMAAKTLVIRD